MKGDRFMDSMNQIDDKLIADAEKFRERPKKKKTKLWVKIVATAACICLIITGMFVVPKYIPESGNQNGGFFSAPLAPFLIADAVYPEQAQYPDDEGNDDAYDAWFDEKYEKMDTSRKYTEKMISFYQKTASEILNSTDGNKVYSPLNIYFALSVLAETTDSTSRQQILKLLGEDSIESSRTAANELWNAQYKDDGTGYCLFANSLWFNKNSNLDRERVSFRSLADNYYTSFFEGDMSDSAFNKRRKKWINEQTGGLLKDSVDKLEFDADTVMNLTSTVNFMATWQDEFSSANTYDETFHSPSGDISCEFMHGSDPLGSYYWGDSFSAVSLNLTESGKMWFILPDEGTSPEKLLGDSEVTQMLSVGDYSKSAYPQVNLSIPKFDISSDIDLTESLKAIGITDVFDFNTSDFSPITDEDIAITSADHSARVAIDEKGVTAAAFTSLDYTGAGLPKDEVDFTLDRPFMFVISGLGNIPLFVGIVNQP